MTSPPNPYPVQILHDAASTLIERGTQRDTGGASQPQERSMAAAVRAFNALEGAQLSERQGWMFMVLLKASRQAASARNGRYNLDDYLDGAAYNALAAEAAAAALGALAEVRHAGA